MKLVIRFGKSARLRFISHLDMQRTFMFALARSGLPIAYTQGFTPHPVISFGSALAMGWTSDYELFEVRMEKDVTPDGALTAFRRALPPDIPVFEAVAKENSHPAAMASAVWADYEIRPEDEKCLSALKSLLAEKSHMAHRKGKSGDVEFDMIPLIASARAENGVLYLRASVKAPNILKPEIFVKCLCEMTGCENANARVHRTMLWGEKSDGSIAPLITL